MQSLLLSCSSLNEIDKISMQLLNILNDVKVVAFKGDMGVGKTTLIKALCKNSGVKEIVTSPTFSIVNEYETAAGEIIYHFDFYRIQSETEAMDIGYENYFFSGNRCFIEWPEKVPNLMQFPHAEVSIKTDGDRRLINVVV